MWGHLQLVATFPAPCYLAFVSIGGIQKFASKQRHIIYYMPTKFCKLLIMQDILYKQNTVCTYALYMAIPMAKQLFQHPVTHSESAIFQPRKDVFPTLALTGWYITTCCDINLTSKTGYSLPQFNISLEGNVI